jgi:hypothetical protein
MAIIFSNNTTVDSFTNGRVYIPNNAVQVVYNTWTGTISSTGSTFVNTFSTQITTRPGSQVLVEYFTKQRQDNGNNAWNIGRHRVIVSQTGQEVFQSGFNGAHTNTIYQFNCAKLITPSQSGSLTFQAQISGWTGTMFFNPGDNDDRTAWLRLTELAG